MCFQQWLLTNKEIINMTLQALMAIAALAIFIALWLQKKATVAQEKATQASMFSDINSRLSQLLGEIPAQSEEETKISNWYRRLFNEFESIIFLVNQKFVGAAMELYFRDFIIHNIDKFKKEHLPLAEKVQKRDDAFLELRRYYQSVTGKKCPI